MQAWNAPPINYFKVNVDAAIQENQQAAGLGAVIQNSSGQVIITAVRKTTFQGNISTAEAQAVKWGMQVAKEANLTKVIIETDFNPVVDLVNNKTSNRTEIWWTILDIQRDR